MTMAHEWPGLRVLVIDDHALFAEGLMLLLGRLGEGIEARRVETCEEALESIAREGKPDLILFDLMLPGVHHVEAFRLLDSHAPGVPLVAVSADERPRMIADLLRAGARGYIPKSTNTEIMLGALRLVLSGGTFVPEAAIPEPSRKAENSVPPRERQVLELLAAGHGNKSIAAQLRMAESTVRVHVTSILKRLGLASRADVASSPVVAELLRRPKRRDSQ
jgi:DNA-binding NarL/FixJ family response regulator